MVRLESGYDERRARVEIVPLMDVVFLLLVFFIYAMFSLSTHRGLRVALPAGPGEQQAGHRQIITIRADNGLELDGRELPLPEVVLLAADRQRREGTPVLIAGDRAADLGTGVELLARLRAAGVADAAFQVRPEPAPEGGGAAR